MNNVALIFPHEKGRSASATASNHIEQSRVHPLVLHCHLFAFFLQAVATKRSAAIRPEPAAGEKKRNRTIQFCKQLARGKWSATAEEI